MSQIGNTNNWYDVYLRDLVLSVKNELHNKIYFYNKWEDEYRKIDIPFYYSMSGDDNFILDSFYDDIPTSRIDGNYDKVPRGIFTLENWNMKTEEVTNPNVRISRLVDNYDILKRYVSKIRALPLTATFNIKIKVASEVDLFKIAESFWNLVYNYQYFDFEFKYFKIKAHFKMPDITHDISRDIKMDSEIYKTQTFTLNVQTYYPLFGELENIPPLKKVEWQHSIWKLNGSGLKGGFNSGSKNCYPQVVTKKGL